MQFTRGSRWLLFVGFLCAAGYTATTLFIPYVVGRGVDHIGRLSNAGSVSLDRTLVWISVAALGVAVLRYLFSGLRRYTTNNLSHVVEYRIRNALFAKKLGLSHSFYDAASTGELVSRSTNDLRVIRFFVGWGMFQMFISVLTLVVVSAILLYTAPGLAAIVLLPMPLLALAAWRFASRVHPIFKRIQGRLADVTTSVQENVSGIRVVKSFSREPFESGRFGGRAEGVMNETLAARTLRAFYIPAMTFLPAVSVVLLVFFGGRAVINGELSLGAFVSFQLYLMQLVWPMQGFGIVVDQGQRAIASGERIFEVLDAETEVTPPENPEHLPGGALSVEFAGVSFSYGSGERVLGGLDLSVGPGETVAVVGATGSGKSTLLSLVPRFYDPQDGEIRIGGMDVRSLEMDELRRAIGIVPQETFLFSETVRENIAFGTTDATDTEIVRAAKIAGVHDQIAGFPEGYDTLVGEWGITLSGGQKQRLAIARALVKNPRLLLLDDATSSVDAETEKQIQAALREALSSGEKRTTFIVAHRLSTILLADRIAVMEAGRIVEFGTHDELIRNRGVYAGMYGDEEDHRESA
ncbi:ABC transporter ATP-binding protein [Rubrobacter indicoceani]|uniref:ABC transporter ATP-binding protein n=1 Tax=Rubrobacter indicoceani TaxID=2051957 RepID=UPI001F092410|nr:ABC transporter ATP-binding protein [Rubrobacter indicoceani]